MPIFHIDFIIVPPPVGCNTDPYLIRRFMLDFKPGMLVFGKEHYAEYAARFAAANLDLTDHIIYRVSVSDRTGRVRKAPPVPVFAIVNGEATPLNLLTTEKSPCK